MTTRRPATVTLALLLLTTLATTLAGCVGGLATVDWSPDGTRGVYGIFDAEAKPVRVDWFDVTTAGSATPLAAVVPPFQPYVTGVRPVAWSADSRSLYFARRADDAGPAQLCRRRGSTTAVVATLGAVDVATACVSPDERWAAVLTTPVGAMTGHPPADADDRRPAASVVVVRLADGVIRTVTDRAAFGVCFTGPDRLAYVEQGEKAWRAVLGRIVEVQLDDPRATPDFVAAVLCDAAVGLRATPDGLLFLAARQAFPTTAPAAGSMPDHVDLYRWTRATNRLAVLVDGAVAYDLSPDAARVAFVCQRGGHDLAAGVARVDGTGERMAPDGLLAAAAIPPAWRGNDHLTAAAAPGVERPGGNAASKWVTYDLVDYAVAADGTLTPGRTLSAAWPDRRKPFTATYTPAPTTAPATRP